MEQVVYIHTCNVNGKSYVGVTNKAAEDRFVEHCQAARRGSRFAFHAAIRKYGEEAWTHETVATVGSLNEAHEMEVRLIAERRTTEREFGYNMTAGGDGFRGLERTEEHAKAISEALMGHIHSDETRQKLAQYKGEKASFYGRKQSDEWKAKMKELLTNNHPMKGVTGAKHHDAGSFVVTFPDGREIEIKGLAEFCRQNGLTHSAMSCVAAGKRNHHKGFKCRKAEVVTE